MILGNVSFAKRLLNIENRLEGRLDDIEKALMRAREGSEAIEAYRNVLREGTGSDAVILGLTVVERMGGKECIRELINEGLGCPLAGGLL